MSQELTLAFTFAKELAIQLITLATAVIGFTVTFSKDFGVPLRWWKGLLILAWGLFLFSILFGVATLMALTGSLAPLDPAVPTTEIGFNVRCPAAGQIILFGLGVLIMIVLGTVTIWSRDRD
jgi:hypothetical protein